VRNGGDPGAALRHPRGSTGRVSTRCREAATVEIVLAKADSAATRRSLALEAFERRRHDSPTSLIAAGAGQGASINSISGSWGSPGRWHRTL